MSGMLERVARSIWAIRREEEDRCDMELEDMRPTHSVWSEARAAIEAMREPTEGMVEAAYEASNMDDAWSIEDDLDWLRAHKAALDAALAEPQS